MVMSGNKAQHNTRNSGIVGGNPVPWRRYKMNNGLKMIAQHSKGLPLLLAAVGGIVGTGAALAAPLVISGASWN